MSLSRSSLRAWSLYSRSARPSSSSITTTYTIVAHRCVASDDTLTTRIPGLLFTSSSLPLSQRRAFAGFKRYTMDQALVNDLKSQPRDDLLFRNGDSKADTPKIRTAYIALGSNLGDRVAMIEQACNQMDACGIKVKRTSSLWETEPMYVLDQDRFVNGACEVCLVFIYLILLLIHLIIIQLVEPIICALVYTVT